MKRLMAILFLAAVPAFAQIDFPLNPDFKYFKGQWIAEYGKPESGMTKEILTYTPGERNGFLKTEIEIFINGKRFGSGFGFLGYDDMNKKIRAYTAADAGFIHIMDEIERKNNWIRFSGTAHDYPLLQRHQVLITKISDDEFSWEYLLPKGDGWVGGWTMIFKRVKADK